MMQSNTKEPRSTTAELKVVDPPKSSTPKQAKLQQDSYGVVVKGRLARQRGFEVAALFERLKEIQNRADLLEETLRQVQPHFFESHPIYQKIVRALNSK
ncbi:hypothetical protein [Pseudomonas glycinae]|uniref:hypothetical protein n=1 Tax=Pseudomonas glycinae TaxID=1785145 RepID=UPI002B1D4253|nr:hypothetical protein [Pseudomonas glycinae]